MAMPSCRLAFEQMQRIKGRRKSENKHNAAKRSPDRACEVWPWVIADKAAERASNNEITSGLQAKVRAWPTIDEEDGGGGEANGGGKRNIKE